MKVTKPLRNAESTPIVALAVMALLAVLSPIARAQEPAQSASPVQATDAKRSGQDVPVPTRKKYVAPEYPTDAANRGARGIVILELLIGEDGSVQNARVTRSIPGLDEAALAAVRLWEYEPTKLAGRAVKVLHSQGITFTMKLPDLERAPGLPELKSGGSPRIPSALSTKETASIAVSLGSEGEVKEAAVIDGNSTLGEALMRSVKFWRFVVTDGPPPSFTVRGEWTPGPPPALILKAIDPRTGASSGAGTSTSPQAPALPPAKSSDGSADRPGGTSPQKASTEPALPASSSMAPDVQTEVLTARQEPPAKEQGISAISDVMLGENIPDLVKGRRPVWPPLARLGSIAGEVVVRFSVDLAGKVTVHSAEGPEFLKTSAEQATGTWLFRRTAIDRLHLIATFNFGGDRAMAKIERVP